MARAAHHFPSEFLWGTATAGYQVEGQSTGADFWEWEHGPGRIAQGHRSGRACDWWEGGLWQADFDRAAASGQTAHRLSVEWSRIQPEPGRWDLDALDHYRQMVRGLRARGLTPLVTLHHFVNPQWLTTAGHSRWETPEIVPLFEAYVRRVVEALRDDVDLWATINEPNVYLYQGWVTGVFPPGRRSLRLAGEVAVNLLRAHVAAYRAIHALQPTARVGLPVHFRPIFPAQPNFVLDRWAARMQFERFSALFPDALRTGRLKQFLRPAVAVPEAKGAVDFFGLNYYAADLTRFDLTNPGELFGRRTFPPGSEPDSSGLYASYPPGFFEALKWAEDQHLPIYVTENGIGDEADGLRRRYLVTHLRQLWRAVQFNWDVRGYFHWSLVDNFEWERGWTHRFGLYALDPETQVRTPRPSAALYAAICQGRALTSDLVATHTPELLGELFPG